LGHEPNVSIGKVDLYLLHALFFEKFMNMKGAGIAIHSTDLPLDLLHDTNLPKPPRSAFGQAEYLNGLLLLIWS
jgi:hypothetical protein